jgi:prepilin peptidase CpaA
MGLGLVAYGVLAAMGGMGMGDVKLCAAIGAWLGPEQLLFSLVVTGIVGGIMALGWAVTGGFLRDLFRNTVVLVSGWKTGLRPNPEFVLSSPRARKMPYAPAIAIGTLLSFLAH